MALSPNEIQFETIRAHGGDVWCEGSATGGARFVVRLPVVDPAVGDAT